jgi:ligand-binding sensor protein
LPKANIDGGLEGVTVDSKYIYWRTARLIDFATDCCGEVLPTGQELALNRLLKIKRIGE